jgi:hypothetical protein
MINLPGGDSVMATQLTFQFDEGGSIPTSPLQYIIKPIPYKLAMDVVIEHHYLHRRSSCSYAFGIYTPSNLLLGVITYGSPVSRSLQKGICGNDEANNVIELTRLWVDDRAPKNIESFFIGRTLKMIPNEIIVSYAEIQQGHLGIIYQATNWIYTGLSDKHVIWFIDGVTSKHPRHIFDSYGGFKKAQLILGDRIQKQYRPRKHRYIFFQGNKKRKKELLTKLRYPILPYPKRQED